MTTPVRLGLALGVSAWVAGISGVMAFTCYDCNDTRAVFAPLDLTSPAECQDPDQHFQEGQVRIVQILQVQTDRMVEAFRCHILLTRTVHRCGIDSIHYGYSQPVLRRTVHLSPMECRKAVQQGEFRFEEKTLNATVGTSNTHQFYSHGHLNNDHTCQVDSFTRGGIYFKNSYERTELEITIARIHGNLDLATQIVVFANHLRAPYMDAVIKDDLEGTIVWAAKTPPCQETTSGVYLGNATIHLKTNHTNLLGGIVLVEEKNKSQYAGLLLVKSTSVCATHGYTTQIPGVVVVLLRALDSPIPQAMFRPQSKQDEIQAKTGMGFLHLAGNLKAAARFATVWQRLCELERSTLHNKLQAIVGATNPYALLDTHGYGRTVIVAGAVAYVAKCPAKDATVRSYPNCTQEIPVMIDGMPKFVDPISLVVRYHPRVLPCDDSLPVRWRIAGAWFCSSPPGQVRCQAPVQLKPGSKLYLDDTDFTEGFGYGLFSEDQMRQHLMMMITQDSREAALNKVTDAMISSGRGSNVFGLPLTPADYNELRGRLGMDLVPMFQLFGTYWSVVFGILVALGMLKLLLGMLTRAYLLWVDRGCGWWLLTAFWQTAFLWVTFPVTLIRNTTRQVVNQLEEGLPHVPGEPRGGGGGASQSEYARLSQIVVKLAGELEGINYAVARLNGGRMQREGPPVNEWEMDDLVDRRDDQFKAPCGHHLPPPMGTELRRRRDLESEPAPTYAQYMRNFQSPLTPNAPLGLGHTFAPNPGSAPPYQQVNLEDRNVADNAMGLQNVLTTLQQALKGTALADALGLRRGATAGSSGAARVPPTPEADEGGASRLTTQGNGAGLGGQDDDGGSVHPSEGGTTCTNSTVAGGDPPAPGGSRGPHGLL